MRGAASSAPTDARLWPTTDCASVPEMRFRSSKLVLSAFCPALLLSFTVAQAQEAPLKRTFTIGASVTYRIRMNVRSEITGQRTEKIGEVTYAVPLARSAECRVSWRATQRILEAAADGGARVEESLDNFEISEADTASDRSPSGEADKEAAELARALRETLAGWGVPRIFRYRQHTGGQLFDLPTEGGPLLGEQGAPVLTLWLLRALRPAAVLPARPLRIGDRWQEPRAIALKDWTDVHAVESGEWLDSPRNPDAVVRLHQEQQISGRAAPAQGEGALELHFHAESLHTVSLQDGGLLAATRSGVHELTHVLGPVAGLPEPPRFRATLSAQVEIEECDDPMCPTPRP